MIDKDLFTFGRYKEITVRVKNDATNGDVIKTLFPNGKIWKSDNSMCLLIDGQGDAQMFDIDWWNTPYKAERSEKNDA